MTRSDLLRTELLQLRQGLTGLKLRLRSLANLACCSVVLGQLVKSLKRTGSLWRTRMARFISEFKFMLASKLTTGDVFEAVCFVLPVAFLSLIDIFLKSLATVEMLAERSLVSPELQRMKLERETCSPIKPTDVACRGTALGPPAIET